MHPIAVSIAFVALDAFMCPAPVATPCPPQRLQRVAEAKLAEREILHQAALRRVEDPDSRAVIEDEYRRDRERVLADRDRKIEEIRGA